MKLQDIRDVLTEQGFIFLERFHLHTQEDIIEEQKEWDNEHLAKNVDFTIHNFWLTIDDGRAPRGFDTINEMLEELEF